MSHLRRYLEAERALADGDLEAAVRRQQVYGGSLDTVLLELELCAPHQLAELLRQACNLPLAPAGHFEDGLPRPWDAVPEELQELGWALPLLRHEHRILVAVHPDLPNERLGALYRAVRGVEPFVAPECCIEKLAAERRGTALPQRYAGLYRSYVRALRKRPTTEVVALGSRAAAIRMAAPAASSRAAPAVLASAATRSVPALVDARQASANQTTNAAIPQAVTSDRVSMPSARPRSRPSVYTTAGTLVAEAEQLTAHFDEDDVRRRISEARAALDIATDREAVFDALTQALVVLSPRIALIRMRGRTLTSHPTRRSGLHNPANPTVEVPGESELEVALQAEHWEGLTPELLLGLLAIPTAVPCALARVDVAQRPVLTLYIDHGGRTFLPVEIELLGELARATGGALERILTQRRALANAPPPTPRPAQASDRKRSAHRHTGQQPPLAAEPPLPPPPPMADDRGERKHDTLHGLPAPLQASSEGYRFIPPPLDEREATASTSLAAPVVSARGHVALEDDEWARPNTASSTGDEQQRMLELALRRICEGQAGASELEPFTDAGITALAAAFPGPLEILRRDLRTLPPPSAHGPLIRVAITLGHRIVAGLLERFADPEPDVRFYAAFVFQELRDPRCIAPLAQLAFDDNGDVRVVAMRVLETYAHAPEYAGAQAHVREPLTGFNGSRRLQATRAVGILRDTAAIEPLIELLGGDNEGLRDAALESLCSITGQQYGLKPARWRQWHAEHGHRHRLEWIIDSLRHRDLPVRRWAADELVRVTGYRIPFSPLGDRKSREMAVRAWTHWWETQGRERFCGAGDGD